MSVMEWLLYDFSHQVNVLKPSGAVFLSIKEKAGAICGDLRKNWKSTELQVEVGLVASRTPKLSSTLSFLEKLSLDEEDAKTFLLH